ncbi:MAG: DoxX family protein [Mesorhizobium sp.]|uniref:DoxX family protein n=1 Tax=Mesorhizobium sp. TaxID=1871066 RepID=UPI0011FCCF92|nr:DoxX family protein [Mesorhizobium sp.]TIO52143.1 MAG: DoxX family protein [Mesorhizobium sp.]TIO60807.1 MAG: DoxX family protein [Mesorhizobium sp.]TJV65353.1 MAG: DoxX family protein [Mesorhizobium sp.]
MREISHPAGRLLLIVLFAVSGLGKWSDLAATVETIAPKGFPAPFALVMLTAVTEVLDAFAIIVAFLPRLAAVGLAAHALVTALVHTLWKYRTRGSRRCTPSSS